MKAFLAMDIEGPIRMLNPLRYKPDRGRETYAQYAARTSPLLEKRRGKTIYRSEGRATVIGAVALLNLIEDEN